MASDIQLTDLTNGSLTVDNEWVGTGVFDKLIEAVNKNIEGQYNKGRITGPDYASVYLGGLQSVIAQSIEFILREKLTEAQTEAAIMDKLATKARVEDEFGKIIDANGNVYNSTDEETRHHWIVENLKKDYDKAAAEVASNELDNAEKGSKLKLAYGTTFTGSLPTTYLETINYGTLPSGMTVDSDGNLTLPASASIGSTAGLEAIKLASEVMVARNTAEGYKADSYYKVYRSLQELMFSLTNSGIIDETTAGDGTTDNVYGRILQGMETSINGQLNVWGVTSGIDLNGDGA